MKLTRTLLLLLALTAISACGDSAEPGASSSVLNRGIVVDPETLDAHKARTNQAADVLRDIGEGLVSYSANGELVAGVAERWTISDDGLTYRFDLRHEARWSNGDPVTAGDFVFAFERLADPDTAAFYAQLLGDISGAEAVDDWTLLIQLERPTPYLVSLLTHPATFPMHPGSLAKHGDRFARPGNLVSNGAYELTEWVPGSVLTLKRNAYYWNDDNTSIDEVRHHVITQDSTELARYRAGEIDITGTVPPDSFKQLQEDLGEQLHVSPRLGVYYYGYNLSKPMFKDGPELRQALSMAIDRELLVEKVTGRGEAPAYSWVPPGVDNYSTTKFSYAELTQEERNQIARTLYMEAGYSDENPLQFELRYNTSDTQQRVALAIQSMWLDVLGAEVTLVNEEFQVLLANIQEKAVTEVFRLSWIGDYNDAHAFLSVLQSGNETNSPGYVSDEYDSLFRRAGEQADLNRRRSYLEEAERVMLADHPVIPIYFYVNKHLVSPRVDGWGDNVLDYHYSQHLSLKAAE
jgi:oligopeptide transport system substrate-binding protein